MLTAVLEPHRSFRNWVAHVSIVKVRLKQLRFVYQIVCLDGADQPFEVDCARP